MSFRYCDYLFIFVFALLANYPSVFEYKSMYLDDMGRYELARQDKIHDAVKDRNFLTAYYMYFGGELLETDLRLVRSFTLGMMILASIAFYYLLCAVLQIPRIIGLTAAILPNILPGIDMLPSFLSGSYSVPGTLVATISVISGCLFLKRGKRSHLFFPVSLLFYFFSFEFMDQSLPLIVPLILIFYYQSNLKISKKLALLCCGHSLVALQDLYRYLSKNQPEFTSPVSLSVLDIWDRVYRSFGYVLPVPRNDHLIGWLMLLLFILCSIGGILAFILTQRNQNSEQAWKRLFPAFIGLAIFVCVGSIFWFKSPYFSNRYFHLPAYGTSMIIGFFLYSIVLCKAGIFARIQHETAFTMLGVFLLFTAVSKHQWLDSRHSKDNYYHSLLASTITNFEFPELSQIIITGGTSVGTGGYYPYSSGYLKFLTNRADISGVFSKPEMQYYDPFRVSERAYVTYMTGIDLNFPVFLFRIDKANHKLIQFEYALQWKASEWTQGLAGQTSLAAASAEELQNSEWVVYRFDLTTGEHSVAASGEGIRTYQDFEKEFNKTGDSSEILFGGAMSDNTLQRFGLYIENPKADY